jgi:hypothetical protein
MKLGLNTISVWFGMIMILVVLSGAIAFAFTDVMNDKLYGSKRIFFVVLLVAYAVYRFFRLKQVLKQKTDD